ncbi:hypothetical protein GCM10023192_79880 [Amycolatopsis samaneae]
MARSDGVGTAGGRRRLPIDRATLIRRVERGSAQPGEVAGGAQAQPTEAKARGGEHSRGGH